MITINTHIRITTNSNIDSNTTSIIITTKDPPPPQPGALLPDWEGPEGAPTRLAPKPDSVNIGMITITLERYREHRGPSDRKHRTLGTLERDHWNDRGSSVNIGAILRILAWPPRKDDTHTPRSVNNFTILRAKTRPHPNPALR